jgi:hypothetical protein
MAKLVAVCSLPLFKGLERDAGCGWRRFNFHVRAFEVVSLPLTLSVSALTPARAPFSCCSRLPTAAKH